MTPPAANAVERNGASNMALLVGERDDTLLEIVLSLASELAVTRQRLDSVERLLARHALVARDEIEDFRPNVQEHDERQHWQQDYIRRMLGGLRRDIDRAGQGSD